MSTAHALVAASVRKHVIQLKEALLAEVEAVEALEREIMSVSDCVTNLVTDTTQFSDALTAPYTPMSAAVNRASNIAHATVPHRRRFSGSDKNAHLVNGLPSLADIFSHISTRVL